MTEARTRGRPPGAKNKRTEERERQVAEASTRIGEVLGDAFAGDAHALLMAVYKDITIEMNLRLDAAKAAIRYEKPALSTIEAKVKGDLKASFTTIRRVVVDPKHPDA